MSMVMGLNASMVLYGDSVGLSHMVGARNGSEPPLVGQEVVPVEKLPPCATHEDKFKGSSEWTHPVHMPSTDLGCVWSGKASLLRRSAELHPEFDWYMWMDAGLHDQRVYNYVQASGKTWPSPEKIQALPKDTVIVAHSQDRCDTCTSWDTYCHCVSGMAFIVPKALVNNLATLFTQYQEMCLREKPSWICLNDQVIMTHVRNDFPDMFFTVGSNYGAAATVMWTTYDFDSFEPEQTTFSWPVWSHCFVALLLVALVFLTLAMGPRMSWFPRQPRQLLAGSRGSC